jgi:uncharacterized Fe-S cluster protein YjdI
MKKKEKIVKTRFCGDLTKIKIHLSSKEKTKHYLKCAVCGENVWTKCGVCDVGLHDTNSKSKTPKNCFMDFHDNCLFGLCRNDSPVFGVNKTDWTAPTARDREMNKAAIKRMENGAMPTRSRDETPPRSTPHSAVASASTQPSR